MSASYKDLEFSFSQRLILYRLKYFKIKKDSVYASHKYDFLRTYSLIDYFPKNHLYLILNEKGKMYLRYKHKDTLRFWIPVIISILALLSGYGIYINPMLERLLQEVMTLTKTIWESLDAVF